LVLELTRNLDSTITKKKKLNHYHEADPKNKNKLEKKKEIL
jgi:hypothetical protein